MKMIHGKLRIWIILEKSKKLIINSFKVIIYYKSALPDQTVKNI